MPKEKHYTLKEKDVIMDAVFEMMRLGISTNQALEHESVPICHSTFYKWIDDYQDKYSDKYSRAQETFSTHKLYECLEIADDCGGDIMADEYGNVKDNYKNVQRAGLMVKTRMDFIAKCSPRKYGNHKAIELSGRVDGEYKVNGLDIKFVDVKDE